MLASAVLRDIRDIVGAAHIRQAPDALLDYGTDALLRGHPADLVVLPGSTADVAQVVGCCDAAGVPVTPRGAGTGYTGGAVPTSGGVVVSLERLNHIKTIDVPNLLAVVEPHVVTGDLQDAVERVGLFYPPDPASLRRSVIGGNVAECAGGPRAFKYGTTKRYVLGLEVVLASGAVVRTGGKTVKNVVGYDLTQLLVGSEGTLGIITEITLRLLPRPAARRTLRAAFRQVAAAVDTVVDLIGAGVVPAALELVDAGGLRALADAGVPLAPADTDALILIEVDGTEPAVEAELDTVATICRDAGATVHVARDTAERDAMWDARRQLSLALRARAPRKINHDVVVPTARIPELFETADGLRRRFAIDIVCFGHVGDGNIHVNLLVDPDDAAMMARARDAERTLFEAVVRLEGSISGEHGIGFAKADYLGLELSPETIALMRRVKAAFDPHGILNPGKIFPRPVPD